MLTRILGCGFYPICAAYEWFMKYQTQIKATPETIQMSQNIYQKSGWKGILREMIAQDENRLKTIDYPGLYYEIACFSARLGDKEKAFEYLKKSYESSNDSMIFVKVDPYLDSLHGDSRFKKLSVKLV